MRRIILSVTFLLASGIEFSHAQLSITPDIEADAETSSSKVSSFGLLAGSGETGRTLLTTDFFLRAKPIAMPLAMEGFAMPENARHPSNNFEGILSFGLESEFLTIRTIQDDFGYLNSNTRADFQRLPKVSFEITQQGSYIFPALRGAKISEHPYLELMLEPGRVWDELMDEGWTRAAIPFALQEKNANCIHNGVMSFLFRDDGQISDAALQVSSETCMYFKFNLFGKVRLGYQPTELIDQDAIARHFEAEIKDRMEQKGISELDHDFEIDSSAFGNPENIPAAGMSLYGVVVNGVNYVGGCETRHGIYPYCDRLVVPSYSLAKSLVGGLAFMRLQQQYPSLGQELIEDWVPECQGEKWQDVTFENVLDMATGNYRSRVYMADEEANSIFDDFFSKQTHKERIEYSCNEYRRRTEPGTRWVYHTSDTYILGTALNAFLRSKEDTRADILEDLLIPDIWRPLRLSSTAERSIRSYDEQRQPAVGWGLAFLADDVGKLMDFLNNQNAEINDRMLLDKDSFAAAMQRDPEDSGLSVSDGVRYNQGFWAINFGAELGCAEDVWIPFMSGFGGITAAMFPNGLSYYYFSDQNYYSWLAAAQEANRFRNFCL
ncbi:MAG: serine hydrolase [Porticoccaceae bacterium]|nr:serine hydrolase [Porticoccaceae bacterium]